MLSIRIQSRTNLSAFSKASRQVVGKPCVAGALTTTSPLCPFIIPLNDCSIASRIPRSANVLSTGFLRSMVKRTRSPFGTPVLINEMIQSVSRKLVANFPSCRALRSVGLSPKTFFHTNKAASPLARSSAGEASHTPSTRLRTTTPWAVKSIKIRSARLFRALATKVSASG